MKETELFEDENTIWNDRKGIPLSVGDLVEVYDEAGTLLRNASVRGKYIQSHTERIGDRFRIVSFDNAEVSTEAMNMTSEIVPTKRLQKI